MMRGKRIPGPDALVRVALSIVVIASVAILALAYLFISDERGLVVDSNGEVKGIVSGARAKVQGQRFWRRQEQLLRWRIDYRERFISVEEARHEFQECLEEEALTEQWMREYAGGVSYEYTAALRMAGRARCEWLAADRNLRAVVYREELPTLRALHELVAARAKRG